MRTKRTKLSWMLLPILLGMVSATQVEARRPDGQLEIRILEEPAAEDGAKKTIPARVVLTNSRGRAMANRKYGTAVLGNHFYVEGNAVWGLRRGPYTFTVDAGPEYKTQDGHFEIERRAEDSKDVPMQRFVTLADEGWFAADLESARPADDLSLLQRAEQLFYTPQNAWQSRGTGWEAVDSKSRNGKETRPETQQRHAVSWQTDSNSLMVFDTQQEWTKQRVSKLRTGTSEELRDMRGEHGVIAADISSWHLPLWIADGQVDAVFILHRSGDPETQFLGRRPSGVQWAGLEGKQRWRETIYFHLLNAGFRIAPVAGSGSGVNERPIGEDRVYIFHDYASAPTVEQFWDAVLDGNTVVTNGPLLRTRVAGTPPGERLRLYGDESNWQVGLNLSTRQTIDYLEIIKNGEPFATVRLADLKKSGGQLPEVTFEQNGWFLVRVITNGQSRRGEEPSQRAMTAPYFVERADSPSRVSAKSCQFFLDWIDAMRDNDKLSVETASARQFWQNRLAAANVP